MDNHYLKYPETVLLLAGELKRGLDAYRARQVSEKEIQEMVFHYASTAADLLFDGEAYNITIQRKLGSKRMRILDKMLNGYQRKMF